MSVFETPEAAPTPIVFCNVGWMERYDADDYQIYNGGSYNENNIGGERLNYEPFVMDGESVLLGFYETKGRNDKQGRRIKDNQTHIEKIRGCAAAKRHDFVEGVTVVWCATVPEKGMRCVVGWYRNATVFRWYQGVLLDVPFDDGTDERGYNVSCAYEDGTLLPVEERRNAMWRLPSIREDGIGFGQANIWYASEPDALEFVRDILRKIENYRP